jgi:hypothetical protein
LAGQGFLKQAAKDRSFSSGDERLPKEGVVDERAVKAGDSLCRPVEKANPASGIEHHNRHGNGIEEPSWIPRAD